jgi:hypothetical protein
MRRYRDRSREDVAHADDWVGQVRDRAGADAVLVAGGEEADLGVLEKLGGEGVG